MDINQPSPKLNQKSQKRSIRPTLGLLVHNLSFDLRRGVEEVARQKKANLICFPGGIVHDPLGFNSQANILYNLIDPKRFDSLIIWLSAINGYMNPEGVKEFIGQYEPIPAYSASEQYVDCHTPPAQG